MFFLFFLAEFGDKTTLATGGLAAQYHSVYIVAMASTLGTVIPDAIAIYLGSRGHAWMKLVHLKWVSAALFSGFAIQAALGL